MGENLTNAKKHLQPPIADIRTNQSVSLINKERSKIKFALAFRCKLADKYNFGKFSKDDLKIFQKFLDKVSGMTITEVDKLYLKPPDKNDKYSENKLQVQHYEVTKKFRIHGVWEHNIFYVLRLDPNHKVHN